MRLGFRVEGLGFRVQVCPDTRRRDRCALQLTAKCNLLVEQDVAFKKQLPLIRLPGMTLPVRESVRGSSGGGGGGWSLVGNRLGECVLEKLGLALLRACFTLWVGARQARVRGCVWGVSGEEGGREGRGKGVCISWVVHTV